MEKSNIFDIDFKYANVQIEKDKKYFREWLVSALHKEVGPVHDEFVRNLLQNVHKAEDHVRQEEEEKVLLEKEKLALQAHNNNLQKHADGLQQAYAEVTNSTIWKVSKPVRKILDRVKH